MLTKSTLTDLIKLPKQEVNQTVNERRAAYKQFRYNYFQTTMARKMKGKTKCLTGPTEKEM